MEKTKKLKLFIGIFYLILVGLFLYIFFSKFSLQEITSYDFIKNNRDYFFDLRQSNLFMLSLSFILFLIIWVLAAGFGSPVAILAGFIFGKWIGTFVVVFGLSFGAVLLYIFANFFLKDIIKDKFLSPWEIENIVKKFLSTGNKKLHICITSDALFLIGVALIITNLKFFDFLLCNILINASPSLLPDKL